MNIPQIVHVIGITPDANLILKCPKAIGKPREMSGIYDNRNRRIARIVKIFGPTRSPYIKAKPIGNKGKIPGLIGKGLFLK